MRFLPWRRREQAKPIGEAEAYERSYGAPSPEVRVIKLPPRRPRDPAVLEAGERLRRAFLDRLEHRRGTDRRPQK